MTNFKNGLSGSTLKIIAMISMLIDHIGAILIAPLLEQTELSSNLLEVVYYSMRTIGRIAFPIFCFLIVEGFLHTKDIKKYALRLLLFSFISEIFFDLALTKTLCYLAYQNVFFTLFIGLIVLIAIKKYEQKPYLQIVFLILGCMAAEVLKTDYSYIGIVLIVLLYKLRDSRKQQLLYTAAFSLLLGNPFIIIAYALLYFYNGTRGLSLKYVFYCFYPVHLLVLYFLCLL